MGVGDLSRLQPTAAATTRGTISSRARRTVNCIVLLLLSAGVHVAAHDPSSVPITWNREISRVVYDRCAICHRPGGTAFSLMTYKDAQPRSDAIRAAVIARRMPPWGAVKGFGDFRNDIGLTQEQISLFTDWVEGGAPRGNNPNALPPPPKFEAAAEIRTPANATAITGDMKIDHAMTLEGLLPVHVPDGASMQIVAALPGGAVEPLLWLYEYTDKYQHPFLFRKPVSLPAGTVIRGVRDGATILLIPAVHTWLGSLRSLFGGIAK